MTVISQFDQEIVLNIRPGLISALYFLLFDLVLISIIDTVMSRVMASYYYNTVFNGRQLAMKNADIPGVTTFLIGNVFSWVNIVALALKISVLVAVFIIDLEIGAMEAVEKKRIDRSMYFRFNASDSYWNNLRPSIYSNSRESYDCRVIETNDAIMYYSNVFDLAGNISVNDKLLHSNMHNNSAYEIDYKSVQCLAPGKVVPRNVIPTMRVLGCSKVNSKNCQFYNLVTAYARTGRTGDELFGTLDSAGTNITQKMIYTLDVQLEGEWVAYKNTELACVYRIAGSVRGKMKKQYRCLLFAEYSPFDDRAGTLVEYWKIKTAEVHNHTDILRNNRLRIERAYPGPVFEGNISIGLYQKAYLCFLIWGRENRYNWATLSGILVGNAAVPAQKKLSITALGKVHQQTVIRMYAAYIIFFLIIITVVSSAIVCFKLGLRYQPDLSNINRLALYAQDRYSSSIDLLGRRESFANTLEVELAKRTYSISASTKTTGTPNLGSESNSEEFERP